MRPTNRRRTQLAAILGILLLLSTACNRRRKYLVQGEVIAKNVNTNEITLKHGDIPGFMPAMTMPYKIKDPAVVRELQPGDKIAADLAFGQDRGDYWLEDVRITAQDRPQDKPAIANAPQMLLPGDRVPDSTLTNQDGKTIHLSDFAGKALLVTFIYTRCPMPEFCPRLSSQFAKVNDELKRNPADYNQTHLLTISFDPKYDKPAVLREYGLRYLQGDGSGFSHWDFALTKPAEMQRLADSFGLHYEGQDDQIVHSMRVALIAPDGTAAKFWTTDWTWDELFATTRNVARSATPPPPQ
jgi:protein SCO1